MMYIESSL